MKEILIFVFMLAGIIGGILLIMLLIGLIIHFSREYYKDLEFKEWKNKL